MSTPEAQFKTQLAMAQQGNPSSQNFIGYFYQMGKGVSKNNELGYEWYRRAAEQGDAYGQFNLGLAYGAGLGVEQDRKR